MSSFSSREKVQVEYISMPSLATHCALLSSISRCLLAQEETCSCAPFFYCALIFPEHAFPAARRIDYHPVEILRHRFCNLVRPAAYHRRIGSYPCAQRWIRSVPVYVLGTISLDTISPCPFSLAAAAPVLPPGAAHISSTFMPGRISAYRQRSAWRSAPAYI